MLNRSPKSGRLHFGDLIRLKIVAWYDFSYTKNATPNPLYGVPIITILLTLKGNDAKRIDRPRKLDDLIAQIVLIFENIFILFY